MNRQKQRAPTRFMNLIPRITSDLVSGLAERVTNFADPDSKDQREITKFYSSVAWALVNSNEFLMNH